MDDHRVVNWAISELKQEHSKPFFLACGIFRPHLPWYVPQKYFDMYPVDQIKLPNIKQDDLRDIPEAGVKMARPAGDHRKVTQSRNYRKAVQGYLASITFADAQVGRLLDAVDKSRYAKNTVIVLWGDHGWQLGEKEHWRKFALWEDTTRVPLIILAPGFEGGTCERPVGELEHAAAMNAINAREISDLRCCWTMVTPV